MPLTTSLKLSPQFILSPRFIPSPQYGVRQSVVRQSVSPQFYTQSASPSVVV